MIKAIIFDYFGVISSNHYWNETTHIKGKGRSDDEFLNLAKKVNLGQLHWQRFLEAVANRTGQSPNEIESIYERERLDPQIVGLVKQLKETGYKTAILSNASHEFLEPVIKRAHLDSVFDKIIISSQFKLVKPDPRIYQIALDKLGVAAKEAIVIDDLATNVIAARELKIKAILYKSAEQLRADIVEVINDDIK